MNEKILEITKNKDYLTELLSKNTLEEIVEFCKSKGVALTIDDAKEFVELIQSLKVQAQKSSASKEKLSDDALVDKVVGGYHKDSWGSEYDTLDEKIRHEQSTAKTVVKSILTTACGLTAIAAAGGLVYYTVKKDASENHVNL